MLKREYGTTGATPDWYFNWAQSFAKGENSVVLNTLPHAAVNLALASKILGGDVAKLPYECLRVLFPDGSENPEVGSLLSKKRTEYLQSHPNQQQSGIQKPGIIGFYGTVISHEVWETMNAEERYAHLTGNDRSPLS